MKLLSIRSDNQPTNLMDIKFFDEDKKQFILASCGNIAPYFADPESPAKAMSNISLLPHIFGKAVGASAQMVAKEGNKHGFSAKIQNPDKEVV